MSLFISGNISPCETLVPCHGGELGQEEEEPSLQSFIAMTQESFGRESIRNPLHSVSGWFISTMLWSLLFALRLNNE